MIISYDALTGAFLSKITEFDLLSLTNEERTEVVDGYRRHAIGYFNKYCKYDLIAATDNLNRLIDIDIPDAEVDEIIDIISEGMIVQWLKPYVYSQDLLENSLNTKDFTTYSSAGLLLRVGNAYAKAQDDYAQMVRDYTYNYGDLSELHL